MHPINMWLLALLTIIGPFTVWLWVAASRDDRRGMVTRVSIDHDGHMRRAHLTLVGKDDINEYLSADPFYGGDAA